MKNAMKTLGGVNVFCMLLLSDCLGGGGDGTKWKVIRDPGTNNCVAVQSTAVDPGKPETLGTYNSQTAAVSALNAFKQTPDPNKAGFETCM